MAFRLLCLLPAFALFFYCQAAKAQVTVPVNSSSQVRSYVQGQGTASVNLKPTHLRISVPVKVVEETSWDATEKLRQVRQEVVDRVVEMNAVEDSVHVVGFQCVDANNPTSTFVAPGLNRDAPTPKVMAKCYVVADFKVRDLEDHEAMIAMSQSQLEELTSLIPQQENKRRSYSYPTYSSGLTSQQLDSPLALFYARISKEDRGKAFKAALEKGNQELKIALGALGIDSAMPVAINRTTLLSSSRYSHPVDSVIHRDKESLAISIYPDGVNYTVRLNVVAYFDLPK